MHVTGHVTGGDRPTESLSVPHPDRERHEHRPAGAISADCNQTVFVSGMAHVRRDTRPAPQQCFDLCERYSVPLAFGLVSVVPIEAGNANVHRHI